MNHHALVIHTLTRDTSVDSPERARRREHLLFLERETREARRHRRRELVRRVLAVLTPFREAPDVREALR
jgi:hypothetical protein